MGDASPTGFLHPALSHPPWKVLSLHLYLFMFLPSPKDILTDLRERKEGERNSGDRTHNPGMCPDQELNPRPFSLQDDTLTN